ncbi:monovalent cation/H+ antiporter complex subunit F [Cellulomonas sp. Marseille-Q8402]
MTVVLLVCAALFTVAGVLALIRAERGPSMLDRTVALDIIVTVVVGAVALYAAAERRTDVVPILVVLSLVGFVGSVTIARFASVEPEGEGRVRSREEIAQEEAERIRAEEEAESARRARRAREAEASAVEAPRPAEDRQAVHAEHAAHGDEARGARVVPDEDRREHGDEAHVDEHGPGEHVTDGDGRRSQHAAGGDAAAQETAHDRAAAARADRADDGETDGGGGR